MLKRTLLLSLIILCTFQGKPGVNWIAQFKEEKTYMCNPSILKIFFAQENDDEYPSIKPTDEMLKICPTLSQSCCSIDTLAKFKVSFFGGKKSIMGWKDLHTSLYKTFKHKKIVFSRINEYPTRANLDICFSKEENKKIKDYINNVDYLEIDNREALRELTNGFSRYFSGVACEMCSGRTVNSFTNNHGHKWTYILHVDNVYELLRNFLKAYQYSNYLLHVFKLSRVAKCLLDGNVDNYDPPFTQESVDANIKTITECLNKGPNMILTDQNCLKYVYNNNLMQFNGLENRYEFMINMKKTLQTLEGGINKMEPDIEDFIKISTFYTVNENDEHIQFKDAELNFDIVKGIKPTDNPMAQDIWKSIYILNSAISIIAWLMFNK